jgi:hypothetical protein
MMILVSGSFFVLDITHLAGAEGAGVDAGRIHPLGDAVITEAALVGNMERWVEKNVRHTGRP